MGCGNSRLIPDGESIPARIRPLMRLRFSDLRRRKNGSNLETGTLSKKVLLKDHEDNSTSMHVIDKKSVSFSSYSSPSGSTKPAPAPAHINKQDNKDDEDYSPIPIPLSSNNAIKEDLHEDHNKKSGEDHIEDTARSIICPGSPSFRVYFVEEEDDDKASDDVSHNNSPTHDRIDTTTTTTTCANFGQAQDSKVIITKGKEGSRSCTKAISSKKRQGGVRNLLNVKSCYHLRCSGNDRSTQLLARKAQAQAY
ncbi:uncharacterized protein LOC111007223 isoform X2 [Momordica charantia]|uniref:Uncharacterized protein LOC111007223 isoform X2 n=1 Tax=Momordica charantia TaxID=3673 RepID=A0A6J1C0S3_MOMCH|nr:uncharacterized protein LOC111007223 isoform X2 [Momordica charantia]